MLLYRRRALATLLATSLAATGQPALAATNLNQPAGGVQQAAGIRPPAASTRYTAVVDSTGALVRGQGATGASRFGAGEYEVIFATDVTGCAYVLSLGTTGNGEIVPAGFINVVGRSGKPAAIFVETADTTGTLVDESFHVEVGC